jgi:NitT/TauT family transport system substrate-binding protein
VSHLTRRQFITRTGLAAGAVGLGMAGCSASRKKLSHLVIQAPASLPSVALARLVEDRAFEGVAESAEFLLWKTPDEMRARITSGQAHVSGLPVNVAATLYNKGLPIRLVNVYIWGILYLVSADPDIHAWSDVRGEELLIPFRGDSPDIVTQLLLHYNGMELGQDIRVRYVAAAPEAASLLAAGEARHAILSEPSASIAFLKAQEAGVALYRAIDLQESWSTATGQPPRLPMAGVVVLPELIESQPALVERLQTSFEGAIDWVNGDPAEAARLGASYVPAMPEPAMAMSLEYTRLEFTPAHVARTEIEFFFRELAELSPALFGGELPGDDFYYVGK